MFQGGEKVIPNDKVCWQSRLANTDVPTSNPSCCMSREVHILCSQFVNNWLVVCLSLKSSITSKTIRIDEQKIYDSQVTFYAVVKQLKTVGSRRILFVCLKCYTMTE